MIIEDERIDNIWDLIRIVFQSSLLGGILGLVIFGLSLLFVRDYYFDTTTVERMVVKKELVSLKDNMETEGSFFLGIGGFEGNMKYYFMVEMPDGNIMKETYADRTFVREVEGDSAFYIAYRRYEIIDPKHKNHWYYTDTEDESYSYSKEILIVPKGTIDKNYNIDLE